jgi:hypothetical protein
MNLSPQHAHHSAGSTEKRIKRSPRWDNEEGVAATIGTIMTLLVFLTAMGMFTNQFVPVWMSDNESTHMSEAVQQFVTLKSQIDTAVSRYPNSLVAPAPIFVPVTLSSPGIPVFAAATAGILTLSPESKGVKPMFNITFTYKSETGGTTYVYTLDPTNDGYSGGYLDLYCPNRYYVEEHLVYEGGAVILNQTDGEFVIAGLQLSVKNIGAAGTTSRVMQITQVSVEGINKTIGGTGSKGVSAELTYANTISYESNQDAGGTLNITIVSMHGTAWATYFARTLGNQAGMSLGDDFTVNTVMHPKVGEVPAYYEVTVLIDNIKILDHTHATVTMSIGELGA